MFHPSWVFKVVHSPFLFEASGVATWRWGFSTPHVFGRVFSFPLRLSCSVEDLALASVFLRIHGVLLPRSFFGVRVCLSLRQKLSSSISR